ncbi:mitochondrial conserved protein Dpc13 [Schizosaccharomyces pombe]|uniref:Uncharacterized protein PB1A10.16, mitochondrial n=1 Tax=Schizosaccharomyces pombe (strain 972 / ATCC 24843) TaxID=284812 RepID=YK1G_SCHPO|nr:uncharacterized protein SPAPB1A10.16 [Schizosaccharomyces pombe]P0CAN9.1 RecName: Full=Uncharacterized protein PB1A10.16, mitochondrial; Flags: Precursor [Schizosaccharomyces pombe 972h-]CBA11497.1 conserved fungal protein [Schizosaccharomyces pombe]|eukprot:NP_001343072.1 uncharacterized protein SPAPB1A10.16 [Schizosaccharomyces pombe]
MKYWKYLSQLTIRRPLTYNNALLYRNRFPSILTWKRSATTQPDDTIFKDPVMDEQVQKLEEKMSSLVVNDPELAQKVGRLRQFFEKYGLEAGSKPSPLTILKITRDPEFKQLAETITEIFKKSGIQNDPAFLELVRRNLKKEK